MRSFWLTPMTWSDAIPSTASVVFFLSVVLVCGFCLYMNYRGTPRASRGRVTPFPCIHGLSEELAKIVEALRPDERARLVDAALEIIADDFTGDADIAQAIAAYRTDRQAARVLSSKLVLKANLCDSAYMRLEEAGQKEASAAKFRKMCILTGLSRLLEPSTNPKVADELIYEFAAGSPDVDSFASRMIAKLKVNSDSHVSAVGPDERSGKADSEGKCSGHVT